MAFRIPELAPTGNSQAFAEADWHPDPQRPDGNWVADCYGYTGFQNLGRAQFVAVEKCWIDYQVALGQIPGLVDKVASLNPTFGQAEQKP